MKQVLITLIVCAGATSALAQTQWQFESEFVTGLLTFDDQEPGFAPDGICDFDCLLEFEFSDQFGNVWNTDDDVRLTLFDFGVSTSPDDLDFIIFDMSDVTPPAGNGTRLVLIGGPNGQIDTITSYVMSSGGAFRVVPEPDGLLLASLLCFPPMMCLRRRKSSSAR